MEEKKEQRFEQKVKDIALQRRGRKNPPPMTHIIHFNHWWNSTFALTRLAQISYIFLDLRS